MAKRKPQGGTKAAPAPAAEAKAPALESARKAVLRGDHRAVRSLASAVLAGDPPEAARAEAQKLVGDTRPDPAALLVGLLVLATIAFAAWAGLLHNH